MFEHKAFDFEVKELTEAGQVEGYASVFGVRDKGNDTVMPGAFRGNEGKSVPMLWQHDPNQPIGALKMQEDDRGLKVTGGLVLDVPKAREVYSLMKANIIKGLSIGYRTIKSEPYNGGRKLLELDVWEVSSVTFPMLPDAQVSAVKSLDMETMQDMSREEIEEAFMRGAKPSRTVARKFAAWAIDEVTKRGAGSPDESKAQELLQALRNFGR